MIAADLRGVKADKLLELVWFGVRRASLERGVLAPFWPKLHQAAATPKRARKLYDFDVMC